PAPTARPCSGRARECSPRGPTMLVLLPILCFFFLLAAFARRPGAGGRRPAFLRAAVAWGACVAVLTEALGAFHLLTAPALAAAWGAAALAAAAVAFCSAGPLPARPAWRPGRVELACVAAIIVVAAVTGLVACLAAPNNCDSMTYHLARVAHWAENRSVA